jgi:BlaR1 peptidase M56
MLATWMLYCAAIGVLLSAGALALERGLRSLARPTRWAWAGAMALTLALPAAVRFVPMRASPAPAPAASTALTALPRQGKIKVRPPAPARLDLARWDPALRLAWGASSAAVLLGLAAMAGVLAFRRRGWSATEVDGVPVLVSSDVGPAVIGLFRSRIVLPEWALAADGEARRLVLEHEREHVRAGDPRLLAAAFFFAALMPWSPAAWWQLRRLRLALEVDCDARVLRRRADVRTYGAVLLEVGRLASRTRLAVAAFAEPVSFLERRIRIMTAPRVRRPLLRAAAFAALSAVLVAAACEAPQPTQPSAGGNRRLYAAEGEAEGLPRAKTNLREMVARWFPEVARDGVRENEYLFVTLSPEGEVVGHSVQPRLPRSAPGEATQGGTIAAAGREEMAAMRSLDLKTVRSIDRTVQPAGAVAPTPVTILLVQLKGPGEDPSALHMSVGDPPAPGAYATRTVEARTREDGFELVATTREPASTHFPNPGELRAAMDRFYTPAMKAAGVRGAIDITFNVDAQGRPYDVVVHSENPQLVPVGRAIAESLTFGPGASGRGRRLNLLFEPQLVPTRSR